MPHKLKKSCERCHINNVNALFVHMVTLLMAGASLSYRINFRSIGGPKNSLRAKLDMGPNTKGNFAHYPFFFFLTLP